MFDKSPEEDKEKEREEEEERKKKEEKRRQMLQSHKSDRHSVFILISTFTFMFASFTAAALKAVN